MRQSLSELYSTVRKAAVGRGAPHGIAEDLADAVCWLDSLSFDGVSSAVDCLGHWPSDTSAVRLLRVQFDTLTDSVPLVDGDRESLCVVIGVIACVGVCL